MNRQTQQDLQRTTEEIGWVYKPLISLIGSTKLKLQLVPTNTTGLTALCRYARCLLRVDLRRQ